LRLCIFDKTVNSQTRTNYCNYVKSFGQLLLVAQINRGWGQPFDRADHCTNYDAVAIDFNYCVKQASHLRHVVQQRVTFQGLDQVERHISCVQIENALTQFTLLL